MILVISHYILSFMSWSMQHIWKMTHHSLAQSGYHPTQMMLVYERRHSIILQITALKPAIWNKIRNLFSRLQEYYCILLLTTTKSDSRKHFSVLFCFMCNVHFLLWIPAVDGIYFQNKENGLCSHCAGERVWGPVGSATVGWREEISWIPFYYSCVFLGGLCRKNQNILLSCHFLTKWMGGSAMKSGLKKVWALSPFLCLRGE